MTEAISKPSYALVVTQVRLVPIGPRNTTSGGPLACTRGTASACRNPCAGIP